MFRKKYNAYLSVEASIVFPIILTLYMIIVSISVSFFKECYESQKNFILSFREIRFTGEMDNTPMIIYGKTELPEEDYGVIRVINPLNRIRKERE